MLFFAVSGAIGVAVGVVAAPWFDSSILGGPVSGAALTTAPLVYGAAAIGAAASVLAFVLRKRRLAGVAVLASLAAFTALAMSWLHLPEVGAGAISAEAFARLGDSRPSTAPGFWLTAAGALIVGLSALAQLAGADSYRRRHRYLRVSQLWNGSVVHQNLLAEPEDVRVGTDVASIRREKRAFALPSGAGPNDHALFEARFDRSLGRGVGSYELALLPGFSGTLNLGGQTLSATDAWTAATGATSGDVRHLRVGGDDWGKLDFGDVSIVFQFVHPGAMPATGRFGFDTWLGTSAAMAVVVLLGFASYLCWTFDPSYGDYEFRKQDKRAVLVDATALAFVAEVEDKEEPEETVLEPDDSSQAAPDDEGKFGDPALPDTIVARVPKNEAPMVPKTKSSDVGLVNILKSPNLQNMVALSNIIANNPESITSKIAVAMAGVDDGIYVAGGGTNGMGFKNTGTGGGGEGPYGRIHGLGNIDRGGTGLETGVGLSPKKAKRIGGLSIGGGQTAGFCKKENISSVVRSRASAIRGCYEARLQVNDKLAGKLTARWTIGVDGRVSSPTISSGTVPDPAVGNCLLGVVRRFTFHKPEGGVCIVQWPFVFNPG